MGCLICCDYWLNADEEDPSTGYFTKLLEGENGAGKKPPTVIKSLEDKINELNEKENTVKNCKDEEYKIKGCMEISSSVR